MKKLESFQNKCLKKCLKLRPHPVTHRQVRTDTVHQLAKFNTLKSNASTIGSRFIEKCTDHSNEIICNLFPTLTWKTKFYVIRFVL